MVIPVAVGHCHHRVTATAPCPGAIRFTRQVIGP